MKKMKAKGGYANTRAARASASMAKASMKMWPKFKRVF